MRLLTRLSVATSVVLLFGCPQNTGDTSMDVVVQFPAGLASRCVKVVTTGNNLTKESAGSAIDGTEGSVQISVPKGDLPTAVSMKAVGYAADCSTVTAPAEESAAVRAGFATPPALITLTIQKASAVDLDRDGFSPPADCNDSDARVRPGAVEACSDSLDNDCNGSLDCADSACDLGACGSGALCMNSRCTETSCNDRLDGDRDGKFDCADSDCDTKSCGAGSGAVCGAGLCKETSCTNNTDDDGDGDTDCADADCAGASCGTGGTCTASRCLEPNETVCTDYADNDGDNLVDCADPDCNTRACSDMNACTSGETCAGTSCTGGTSVVCASPPSTCYAASGTCEPSTGVCSYAPLATNAPCSDGDACTSTDVCNGAGACNGQAVMCAAPPGQCFSMGTCQVSLDGGCSYTVMTGSSCTDGNACTVGDSCAGDGGCTAGTLTTCTPAECQTFAAGSCDSAGACQFGNSSASTPCTGGMCNGSGTCVPTPDAGMDAGADAGVGVDAGTDAGTSTDAGSSSDAGNFPFAVDNIVVASHPATGGLVINCAQTLTTGPSAAFGTACPGSPNPTITIADGGAAGELAVVSVTSLEITDAGSLTITGSRPVVFLVNGDAVVSGQVLANSSRSAARVGPGAAAALSCGNRAGGAGSSNAGRGGGGGGAGFFSNGGAGGDANGGGGGAFGMSSSAGAAPLFVGCPGGTGNTDTGTTPGGAGGGALQVSVAGSLTVNAILTASGAGGTGASGTGDPGGGAGGSGGAINLQARRVTFTSAARVISNGGGGGGGAQSGTAGNGTDGSINSATVAGGGAADGSGGNGGAGGAGATNPVAGTSASRGGGGGGGAAGRVFIKHYDTGAACSINGGAVISPAANRTNCP